MNFKILKLKTIEEIKQRLQDAIKIAIEANKSTKEYSRDKDLKQESKYDTRALEASYLASAQERRVKELEIDLRRIENVILDSSSTVKIGSLVLLRENISSSEKLYFISPCATVNKIIIDDRTINIISNLTKMGQELIGLEKDDSFEVELPTGDKHYIIVDVS